MTVVVKCFASLREQLGIDRRELEFTSGMRVKDAWAGISPTQAPTNLLSACNMEYVEFDHELKDGDEVAFFPPVTGG